MSSKKTELPDILSRRDFIQLAVRQAVCSATVIGIAPAALASSKGRELDTEKVLSNVAMDLFPHDNFPKHIYDDVARAIMDSMTQSEQIENLVNNGLSKLQESSAIDKWESLSYSKRRELLVQLQAEPVFRHLLSTAVRVIYQHPDVWELIGYGGSAIEHGGYINRGFDDIDWLPAD